LLRTELVRVAYPATRSARTFQESGPRSILGKLLPGHKGSMQTLGATVYF